MPLSCWNRILSKRGDDMIDLAVTLRSNGTAQPPCNTIALALGYAGNRGVYRLVIDPRGEWENLTVRVCWHTACGKTLGTSLVKDGFVDVPDIVTQNAGKGVCTFEGTDGDGMTITSADLMYIVAANSGTEDGQLPRPGTPAWEAFVREVAGINIRVASAEEVKEMLDEIFKEKD